MNTDKGVQNPINCTPNDKDGSNCMNDIKRDNESDRPVESTRSDNINVIKRDGRSEVFDVKKIEQYLSVVSAGLNGIDCDYVIRLIKPQIVNNIKTSMILDILVNVCSNLIDERHPDYQYVAARLMINVIRREVWKSFLPTTSFEERIKDRIERGLYDPLITELYSSGEISYFESCIDYKRDYILSYSGIRQFYDKYLIKNKITNEIMELPQEANMLICMCMFMNETDKEERKKNVIMMYEYLSKLMISLATPIYAGVRGTLRSFSSCCVFDVGDTTDSILSTNFLIGKAITKRYGIGVNINKIRGIGAGVSNGQVVHTGIVPFLKMFEATSKGFIQNGIRGGQCTTSFPFWYWEVETLLELKNNKGVVENRVRGMDYSIGLNRLFLERAKGMKDITLFSSEEVPLLSNDYTYSYDEFKRVYEEYEKKDGIRKRKINALDLLKKIAKERFETGRIYVYFMDNMNYYSVFTESIYSSNLCQEICLPTKPCNMYNGDGLISVCILSCVNVGRINDWNELKEACDVLVKALNSMIDYQEYICPQIECSAKDYRPLGIGISDLFHLLAKKHLRYDSVECREFCHELAERFQYYLLDSSCELAKRFGICKEFSKSKYSMGVLPVDNYKKTLDTCLRDIKYTCDWEEMRSKIKKYGLRNTCLSAIPPTASSCAISNSTPGIDPPRQIITSKMSKYGVFKQVIPEILEYYDWYTFQRNVKNKEYFKLIGVIQKFVDQGISCNSFYMSEDDVSIGDVVNEIFAAYGYGMKSLYYLNSNKGVDNDIKKAMSVDGISDKKEEDEDEGCAGGACSI